MIPIIFALLIALVTRLWFLDVNLVRARLWIWPMLVTKCESRVVFMHSSTGSISIWWKTSQCRATLFGGRGPMVWALDASSRRVFRGWIQKGGGSRVCGRVGMVDLIIWDGGTNLIPIEYTYSIFFGMNDDESCSGTKPSISLAMDKYDDFRHDILDLVKTWFILVIRSLITFLFQCV